MRLRVLLTAAAILVSGTSAAFAQSTLLEALQTGNKTAALKFIDQRADVKATASDGSTALHWAAHNGDVELVDRLIRAGANVNAKNEFGSTPIIEAANSNNTAVIDSLLKAGADANATFVDGQTV